MERPHLDMLQGLQEEGALSGVTQQSHVHRLLQMAEKADMHEAELPRIVVLAVGWGLGAFTAVVVALA
jgi:tRNA A37 threonylcarbamoyladenosine modification protein TsaB